MRTLAVLCVLTLSACAHRRNIMPNTKDIEVRRELPAAACREIGEVTGRTASAQGSRDEALEDLKRDAADRGANYVMLREWSAYGTGVTGSAYVCP